MKHDHIVKYNGKYYAAGEEVPNDAEPLPGAGFSEVSDSDIKLETDAAAGEKSQGRRGRPRKAE